MMSYMNTNMTLTHLTAMTFEDRRLECDTMTYSDFLALLTATPRPVDWREGQFISNTLSFVRPDIAGALNGSLADCFYKNQNIVAFLEKVAALW